MLETFSQPDPLQQRTCLGTRLGNLHAPHQQRHRDVLESAEFGQQMMELIDEADRPVAQLSARLLAELVNVLAVHQHVTRSRPVEPTQQLQQCRLA